MSMFLPCVERSEKQSIDERQPLPEAYLGLPDDEMALRIAAWRAALGDRLCHPRRSLPARRSASLRGSHRAHSFELADAIADHPDADDICFCG